MLTVKQNVFINKEIKSLYKSAFPKRERIPVIYLRLQKAFNKFHFNTYYDDNNFVGFIFYREGTKYIFVNYFATKSECRNKGYGREILSLFLQEHSDKPICLTIESPDGLSEDDIKVRRKNFYERNGFILHDFSASLRGIKYNFMSTKELTQEQAWTVIKAAAGLDYNE